MKKLKHGETVKPAIKYITSIQTDRQTQFGSKNTEKLINDLAEN